jgi:hypothetical protein
MTRPIPSRVAGFKNNRKKYISGLQPAGTDASGAIAFSSVWRIRIRTIPMTICVIAGSAEPVKIALRTKTFHVKIFKAEYLKAVSVLRTAFRVASVGRYSVVSPVSQNRGTFLFFKEEFLYERKHSFREGAGRLGLEAED